MAGNWGAAARTVSLCWLGLNGWCWRKGTRDRCAKRRESWIKRCAAVVCSSWFISLSVLKGGAIPSGGAVRRSPSQDSHFPNASPPLLPAWRLDHILLDDCLVAESAQVHPVGPSDHWPVTVQIAAVTDSDTCTPKPAPPEEAQHDDADSATGAPTANGS